jgi:hypothetical protein
MPSSEIHKFLEERDAAELVTARDAERVMRPIVRFARAHMSHTLTLLAQWPDLRDGDERVKAVKEWHEKLNPRIDQHLDEWFAGDRSDNIRSEYIAAGFREAIANMLACDAARETPRAKLWRQRFTARALEIADVLSNKVERGFAPQELQRRIIIIVVWGEHGAHFPDT